MKHTILFLFVFLLTTIKSFAQLEIECINLPNAYSEEYDGFGWSVAINKGNTAVVGAPNYDEDEKVHIYDYTGTNWENTQTINGILYFGLAVDIDGNYLVIGNKWANTSSVDKAGKVYVYQLINGEWTYRQTLTASNLTTNGGFGNSVAISGDHILVGANKCSEPNLKGIGYFFKRIADTWIEEEDDIVYFTDQGAWPRVDISGKYAIISDWIITKVFGYENGIWELKETVNDDGIVAISGDYAAIGKEDNSIKIYRRNDDVWDFQNYLIVPSDLSYLESLDLLGNYVILGYPYYDADLNLEGEEGIALLYYRTGDNWYLVSDPLEICSSGATHFGGDVALSFDNIIVGAYGYDNNEGKGYIFNAGGIDPCYSQINESYFKPEPGEYEFNAGTVILEEDVLFQSGVDISYSAEKITLRDGFSAVSGSHFIASAISCGNLKSFISPNSPQKEFKSYYGKEKKGGHLMLKSNSNLFNIYPNPASDFIEITVDKDLQKFEKSDKNSWYQVMIYDFTGELRIFEIANDNSMKINVASLLDGIYLVQLIENDQVFLNELIIEH